MVGTGKRSHPSSQQGKVKVVLAAGLGDIRACPYPPPSQPSSGFSRATLEVTAHASLIFSINNNIEQMEWSFKLFIIHLGIKSL